MKVSLKERMLPAPIGGGFKMDGYWVWCGSVIKGEDGNYHMFASRWKKTLPMHPGWLLASEVVRASSPTPEGPYEFQEIVLPARGAEYWDGRATHNPQIKKVGNTYVLYYIGTTHPFDDADENSKIPYDDPRVIVSRANKRIGIATSKSVFGPWKRFDAPILNTRPDKFDNFLTSNPAPAIDDDGKVTMVYKTRTYVKRPYPKYLHGKMEFGVAKAYSFDGIYKQILNQPMLTNPGYELEDPFIWIDEDGYNLIAKDMNGNICGEQFGGVQALSKDGIRWDFQMGMLAYSRNVLWDDGVVREMGNLERPFILFEDGKPTHMFFATSDGKDGKGFLNCTETWNMVIPLKIID